MSYYDDLGVAPNASPEAIRESYRILARLLHPDQQRDPVLKQAAETQMRRINAIYSVLSDPERRRQYDTDQIQPPERPVPVVLRTASPVVVRSQYPLGSMLWITIAFIGLGGILFLATQNQPPHNSLAQAHNTAPTRPAAPAPKRQDHPKDDPSKDDPPAPVFAPLPPPLPAPPKPRSSTPEPPQVAVVNDPAPTAIYTAPSALPALSPPPRPVNAPKGFSGFWAYLRDRKFSSEMGPYPPQFIEVSINERDGEVKGKYKARYYVSDRPISPNVNFDFEGQTEGRNAKLTWRGEGGSAGELQLRLLSDTQMEVSWRATDLGQSLGLGSGTAVLMRRPD